MYFLEFLLVVEGIGISIEISDRHQTLYCVAEFRELEVCAPLDDDATLHIPGPDSDGLDHGDFGPVELDFASH